MENGPWWYVHASIKWVNWFSNWIVARSASSHYLNRWWHIDCMTYYFKATFFLVICLNHNRASHGTVLLTIERKSHLKRKPWNWLYFIHRLTYFVCSACGVPFLLDLQWLKLFIYIDIYLKVCPQNYVASPQTDWTPFPIYTRQAINRWGGQGVWLLPSGYRKLDISDTLRP